MLLILISILSTGGFAALLFNYGERGYGTRHAIAGAVGLIIGIIGAMGALSYPVMVFAWVSAGHKAQIINREYGTNYTQADMFYASDVIDTVRQLDRKRYQIDGDIFRDGKK